MKIDILSLFPEVFSNILNSSILGRAIKKKIVKVNNINIRDFSQDKHNRVDDYPYGGGQGMILKPGPIYRSINSVKQDNSRIIYLSPKGKVFKQSLAEKLSNEKHIILLCGHYEGIDNRITENYIDDEISIGDYVLTGGEIPAMVVIDSVVRLLPGVLSSEQSYKEESHYNTILEYPQYTRPRCFNGKNVPDILLSGNHKKIEMWRRNMALKNTYEKRPDLLRNINLSDKEKEFLKNLK